MERKISLYLKHWKDDSNKKPLLIYGNKQVGKTYTVLKFGEREYRNIVYFNTEGNKELHEMFKKEKTIDRMISKLSTISGENIFKNDTLIVFDNVNDIEVVNGIKVFGKFPNDYHIILITSLKTNLSKFKGEELQYKQMNIIDFEEYLMAINNTQLIEFIKTAFKNNAPMPFHSVALEYYHDYLLTGGMPEAIEVSIQEQNKLLLNSVTEKITDSYKKEISMQDNVINITRSLEVLDTIPEQLQKDNKKFQYGLIKQGGRSKDYEEAINFLHVNGFIYKCYKVTEVKSPLSSCKDKESFKLYYNDTGLLSSKININRNKLLNDSQYKNMIYENSIAISLINNGYSIFYYQSEGKASVDFVIQTRTGRILPIELVTKNMSKSKALTLFMNRFNAKEAIRITEDNFSYKKNIKYVPIYALFCLSDTV